MFHFAAGELEYFLRGTKRFYDETKQWHAAADITLYRAGHDPEMWNMAFARIAPTVFPAEKG